MSAQQHTPPQSRRTVTPNIRALPVLLPRPIPHQPIRSIDAQTFADLHLSHITSDVPDSVLFPFLHGLEGDNLAQNSFFAASSGLDLGTRRHSSSHPESSSNEEVAEGDSWGAYPPRTAAHNVVKVPEYRGLVWVACDGSERRVDGVRSQQAHGHGQDMDFDDDEEDFDFEYDEYDQDDSEEGELMDIDDEHHHQHQHKERVYSGPEYSEGGHMHPQTLRKPATAPIAISTGSHHSSLFTLPTDSSSQQHHHHHHIHHATGSDVNAQIEKTHSGLFPASSPACLDIPHDDSSYDRRLSTSSVTTSESTDSTSTSASDSVHSNFGFGTSASYSTTASSVGQLKDLDPDADSTTSTGADSDSPTAYSPVETASTVLTTPCTSPCTDVSIEDCIPSVSAPPASSLPLSSRSTATNVTLKPSSDTQSSQIDSHLDEHLAIQSRMEEDINRLTITSSFCASDLLTTDPHDGSCMFLPPKVPDGISLRNFGIQVPIYATLSDIVVYSTSATPSATRAALSLAEKFKIAIERKAAERKKRYEDAGVEVIWIRHGGYGQLTPDDEQEAVKIINCCKEGATTTTATTPDSMTDVYGCESSSSAGDLSPSSSSPSNLASSNGGTIRGGNRPRAYLIAYNVFVFTDSLHVLAQKAPWVVSRLPEPGAVRYEEESIFTSGDARCTGRMDRTLNSNGYSGNGHAASHEATMTPAASSSFQSNSKEVIDIRNLNDTVLPAIDFAQRERDEIRELTKATPILVDLVYLGNVSDVPVPDPMFQRRKKGVEKETNSGGRARLLNSIGGRSNSKYLECVALNDQQALEDGEWEDIDEEEDKKNVYGEDEDLDSFDPFDSSDNPMGYDVCIECRDPAPLPSSEQIQKAEEHLAYLDAVWSAKRYEEEHEGAADLSDGSRRSATKTQGGRRPRPAPSASHIVHFTFPASPPGYAYTMWHLTPFLNFLSTILSPVQNPPSTRPKRVLIYSSDGYTESSALALCVLMKERGLDLPGAYLELQVEKGRSFFVYQSDIGVLKKVESQLEKERAAIGAGRRGGPAYASASYGSSTLINGRIERRHMHEWSQTQGRQQWGQWEQSWDWERETHTHIRETGASHPYARSPRNSISYPMSSSSVSPLSVGGGNGYSGGGGGGGYSAAGGHDSSSAPPVIVPSQGHGEFSIPSQQHSLQSHALHTTTIAPHRRPRAQTSPNLPPHVDHQTWFNDPRFDGSFPSRVLPFLYLGNLNHAQNAYMLHALGITHVVSVGECALVPPSNLASHDSSTGGGYHLVAGRGPNGIGSLWIEEREGRIKVLDIKGVCDDGIDSLQHQLAPICDWIEKARIDGGKVLVHCRVGVSRSATVTIAYVMKHLAMPLVDAYLIVRSRRLNILIQPNMRLLYNLCRWEVELARERAAVALSSVEGGKANLESEVLYQNLLRRELVQSLNWPYLAREVHRLNEKYLH